MVKTFYFIEGKNYYNVVQRFSKELHLLDKRNIQLYCLHHFYFIINFMKGKAHRETRLL